jgi:hypothetical protein
LTRQQTLSLVLSNLVATFGDYEMKTVVESRTEALNSVLQRVWVPKLRVNTHVVTALIGAASALLTQSLINSRPWNVQADPFPVSSMKRGQAALTDGTIRGRRLEIVDETGNVIFEFSEDAGSPRFFARRSGADKLCATFTVDSNGIPDFALCHSGTGSGISITPRMDYSIGAMNGYKLRPLTTVPVEGSFKGTLELTR